MGEGEGMGLGKGKEGKRRVGIFCKFLDPPPKKSYKNYKMIKILPCIQSRFSSISHARMLSEMQNEGYIRTAAKRYQPTM